MARWPPPRDGTRGAQTRGPARLSRPQSKKSSSVSGRRPRPDRSGARCTATAGPQPSDALSVTTMHGRCEHPGLGPCDRTSTLAGASCERRQSRGMARLQHLKSASSSCGGGRRTWPENRGRIKHNRSRAMLAGHAPTAACSSLLPAPASHHSTSPPARSPRRHHHADLQSQHRGALRPGTPWRAARTVNARGAHTCRQLRLRMRPPGMHRPRSHWRSLVFSP